MSGYFQTIDKIDFILDNFAPADLSIDALSSLISRIVAVHNIKRNAFLK